MTALIRYDAMCRAISEAHAFDEAKDIRDKSVALAAYFRQAKNYEAERQAADIRVRAERRCGEFLKAMPRSQGARTDLNTSPDSREKFQDEIARLGVSSQRASEWQKLAGVPQHEFESALAETEKPSASRIINRPHVAHNTGNPEWYAAAHLIKAAKSVMGGIDLDPSSCALANTVVEATMFYSKEDDGLKHPWYGRIWLNPSYTTGLVEKFAARLLEFVASGDVTEACCLFNNSTDTSWFQSLGRSAVAICFPKGRKNFWRPEQISFGSPLQGQSIIYFGPSRQKFIVEFASIGLVVSPEQGAGAPA